MAGVQWDASAPTRWLGAVLLAAMAFAAIVATAPLWSPDTPLAAASHFGFSTLCHQLPARSVQLDGHAMSLCHRCSGIYAGIGLGGLLALLGARVDPRVRAVWIGVAGAMLAQVVAGWLVDALDLWPLRVATGLVLGGWAGLALASVVGARRASEQRLDVAPQVRHDLG